MAADFIDGLVKTISQTTKELGKATKGLSERAEQTIEAQKIRNRIAGEEKIIEKIKVDIGNWIYKKHADGEGLDSELSVLCQEIDQHYLKIREFRDSAANIKGQKVCPSCEREVDMSVSFCPYCGTPCPTPEAAEDVEGEAVPVPAEETAEGSNGSNGTETAQTAETSDASGASQEQPLEKETMEEQPAEEINDQKAEDIPEE